jgi:hypothetical protein
VHKARSIQKWFVEISVKNLTGLHRALTSTPSNTFGMNWNADCIPTSGLSRIVRFLRLSRFTRLPRPSGIISLSHLNQFARFPRLCQSVGLPRPSQLVQRPCLCRPIRLAQVGRQVAPLEGGYCHTCSRSPSPGTQGCQAARLPSPTHSCLHHYAH